MMQNATIASSRFSFWAYDYNAGPGWVELTNISEIEPGRWYNVTFLINNDCRYSVQGSNSSYWVSYPLVDWVIVQNTTFATLDQSFGSGVYWLSGWKYRKEHNISGSTVGALSDYQVKIVAHYGSGSDSGQDVYLNGHCQSDFDDVRFTASDGSTLLDYWIVEDEVYSGDNATFWVKVPSIPASSDNVTIYIYYGNSSVSNASDGDATFLFFDDFNGASLNLTKWDVEAGSGYSVSDGSLSIYYDGSTRTLIDADASYAYLYNVSVCTRSKVNVSTDPDSPNFVKLHQHGSSTNSECVKMWWGDDDPPHVYCRVANEGSTTTSSALSWGSSDAWQIAWVGWNSSVARFYRGDSLMYTASSNIPDEALVPAFWSASVAGKTLMVDWVFLRKWVDPEPSQGSWGSEEEVYAEVTFNVRVVDEGDYSPISGASVYVWNSSWTGSASTNSSGWVSFDLIAGDYSLNASANGYGSNQTSVSVSGDSSFVLTLVEWHLSDYQYRKRWL